MTGFGPLALGTVQWGVPYGIANQDGRPSEAEVRSILAMAYANGVSIIDTARSYGESESLVGAFADRRYTKVITKLAADLADGEPERDIAIERAVRSLKESREALHLDQLFAVLLHRGRHRVAWDGAVWDWLLQRRQAGEIRRVGVSAENPEQAMLALEAAGVEIIQVATSLLDQRLVRLGFFQLAAERSIDVFVRSTYLQGAVFMSPADLPPHLRAIGPYTTRIAEWAADRGLPKESPYLLYARSCGATPVVGVERESQLRSAIQAVSARCDIDELMSLSQSVPSFNQEIVDPSLWPVRTGGARSGQR